jgi:hypothetical protein
VVTRGGSGRGYDGEARALSHRAQRFASSIFTATRRQASARRAETSAPKRHPALHVCHCRDLARAASRVFSCREAGPTQSRPEDRQGRGGTGGRRGASILSFPLFLCIAMSFPRPADGCTGPGAGKDLVSPNPQIHSLSPNCRFSRRGSRESGDFSGSSLLPLRPLRAKSFCGFGITSHRHRVNRVQARA